MAATAFNPETSLNIWISNNKRDFSESLAYFLILLQQSNNPFFKKENNSRKIYTKGITKVHFISANPNI